MKKKLILIISSIIVVSILLCILFYNIGLKAVSSDNKEVEFIIKEGSTYYSVIDKLKSENLIKNKSCFKIYIKLNNKTRLEAGTYKLRKNMSVKEIVEVLDKGNNYNPDVINITYKEGKNMRWIASTIASNTNNTVDDVYSLLKDKTYLNELINEYWFIDESILNENIYYSLEGYLFPNTYQYMNKDVSVKDIFKSMLDEMNEQLSIYKNELLNSGHSIHELLTLASIVELEGSANSDRAGIAGVFYNRLNSGWTLGSDVTTYYAAKIEMSDRDLYQTEINDNNYYNTRSNYLAGKLPIGPISNPSIDSIKAVLYPTKNEYYYFVADKNGKTYFTYTYSEHIQKRDELIEAGLWYTYD